MFNFLHIRKIIFNITHTFFTILKLKFGKVQKHLKGNEIKQ